MRTMTLRSLLVCIAIFMLQVFIPCASAQVASLDVDEALSVYRSAVRQSEATAKALKDRSVARSSADEAYDAAFSSALWEGLKLMRPRATAEERASMAGLIGSGKMLADASSGAALADYIVAGFDIDEIVKISVEKDADEAFRLGYAQALKRQRILPPVRPQ